MKKRLCAFGLALCLIMNLALFPLRVRAAASAAVAVSAGVVVTAALMASGIYPYEEQKEFADYVSGNLAELWGDYVEWRENNIINFPDEEPPTPFDDVTGLIVSGSLVVSRKIWNALSDFATWVKDRFAVGDNQTGVQIGTFGAGVSIPYVSENYEAHGARGIVNNGICVGQYSNGKSVYFMGFDGFSTARLFYLPGDTADTVHMVVYSLESRGYYTVCWTEGSEVNFCNPYVNSVTRNGKTYRVSGFISYTTQVLKESIIPGETIYNSAYAAVDAFLGISDVGTHNGVMVDTTTVAPLEALPADKEWGGLSIPEAGGELTVETLQDVIETGVAERQKPIIRPVEVTNPNPDTGESTNPNPDTGESTNPNPDTGESTNPNPDTGESTNPNPDTGESTNPNPDTGESTNPNPDTGESTNPNPDTPLEISDFQIPGLSEVFPFSVPWDIARVFQAFDAAPRCPLDDWSVTLPFGGLGLWSASENPTVSFNLSQLPEVRQKIDQIAVVCRSFLLVLACLLWLLFLAKFVRF